jgi:transcriptional regulator of heat shock response
MGKYVNTKDESLGAKLLENGKALVAREVNGKKVVEIIDQTSDILDQALPIVQKIIQQLVDFFNSVFHRFPTVIVVEGKNYIFTTQPAPFKAIDRVFYLCEEDPNYRMFEHEGKNLYQAKQQLRKELKSLGYLS